MAELRWKSIPEDCIHKIIVRLPLPSAFRLRSVCKRWKNFIFSEAYFSLQSQLPSRAHCFLLSTHGSLACVYNFLLQRWHYLPLPRVIPPLIGLPLSLASASHSLFCFANQVAECSVLFVCNPFTKFHRYLPAMSKIRFIHVVSLTADPSAKSYKILVAGEDGQQFTNPRTYKLLTEVYDSSSDAWAMADSPSPDLNFGSSPGVWCGEAFYCITEIPYGIVAFDMAAKTWKDLKVQMPARLSTPCLMECGGRVLMAGRIRQRGWQRTDSIKIWELQRSTTLEMVCAEKVKMPDRVCAEFVKPLHALTPLACAAVENVICITTYLTPRVLLYDLNSAAAAAAAGARAAGAAAAAAGVAAADWRWRWLPADPLFPRCRDFRLLGFPLEPRMDALP